MGRERGMASAPRWGWAPTAFQRALGAEHTGVAEITPIADQPHAELVCRVKEYLAEHRHRIRLNDLVDAEIRTAQSSLTSPDEFNPNEHPDTASFGERVARYEDASIRLVFVAMLIARWGEEAEAEALLRRVVAHLITDKYRSGLTIWISMQWYPLLLIMYAVALGCEVRGDFRILAALWKLPVPESEFKTLIERVTAEMVQLDRMNAWKLLPGRRNDYTPASEHLFEKFKSIQDQILFLGPSYETKFDRVELLYSLAHADVRLDTSRMVWGPVGRFGWKHWNNHVSPYRLFVDEAIAAGTRWPPIRDGLFGGDPGRFKNVTDSYAASVMAHSRR